MEVADVLIFGAFFCKISRHFCHISRHFCHISRHSNLPTLLSISRHICQFPATFVKLIATFGRFPATFGNADVFAGLDRHLAINDFDIFPGIANLDQIHKIRHFVYTSFKSATLYNIY
jgi:hypothetical protein